MGDDGDGEGLNDLGGDEVAAVEQGHGLSGMHESERGTGRSGKFDLFGTAGGIDEAYDIVPDFVSDGDRAGELTDGEEVFAATDGGEVFERVTSLLLGEEGDFLFDS